MAATVASTGAASSSSSSCPSSSNSCTRALPRSTIVRMRTRAVECCAASSKSAAVGSSVRCPISAPVPSRFVLPPQMIPIPVVIEVDQDEEDELTFLDYDDDNEGKRKSPWLTSQYLSLRLRCSSLMMKEAKDALSRHFKGREPTVSVNSMLNTTADKVSSSSAGSNKKATDKNRHLQLNLISESYHGDTVKFITDVVLSDEQGGYFGDRAVNSTVA
ncbi:hypothetical protein SELMODRAFT_440557 [Selaginella moellendorffii]|uniref:Uncharacterized protein n=1 Tax=Selaginella moellendorffii TaxID=88036 RepID=D8RCH1_SELML|nr:uncharacterized protein LOC9658571 [Selaginella moellendorffii]EFJ29850.1 hypothetical protein SELMODRAFT_440557 [Selaginella moellendorffii]|eukprot:XP_002968734.1 uncharacterized protein LOC9658571 [Selaginella moellendorffii]